MSSRRHQASRPRLRSGKLRMPLTRLPLPQTTSLLSTTSKGRYTCVCLRVGRCAAASSFFVSFPLIRTDRHTRTYTCTHTLSLSFHRAAPVFGLTAWRGLQAYRCTPLTARSPSAHRLSTRTRPPATHSRFSSQQAWLHCRSAPCPVCVCVCVCVSWSLTRKHKSTREETDTMCARCVSSGNGQ